MFGSPIRKRVLEVVNDRIDAAEAKYKEICTQISIDAEEAKQQSLEDLVNGITSKVI